MPSPLNPKQFGEGYSMPVIPPFLHAEAEVSPTTPRPAEVRPPNVFRTREGDAGIRRGPNPNQIIHERNQRLREEKIAKGEDPDYLDLRSVGMGEHWGRPDPNYVPKWPKRPAGPKVGQN